MSTLLSGPRTTISSDTEDLNENKLIRPGLHNLVKVAFQLSELQISHSDPVMFLDSSSDWWIIIAVGTDDYFIVSWKCHLL